MMLNLVLKVFWLLLASYLVLCSHKEEVHTFFDEVHHKDVHHHMKSFNESLNKICKGYEQKINVALEEVIVCGDEINDEALTYCQVVKKHLRNCTKPLTNIYEECLPTGLKNWPSFILDMVLSLTEYLCVAQGQYLIELGNTCIKNTNRHTEICARLSKKKFETHGYDNLPTTKDLCRISNQIKPCFDDHVKEACHDNITQTSFIRLYEAVFKPCKL